MRLRVMVELSATGERYAVGDILVLPPERDWFGLELVRYGIAEVFPASEVPPVKARRRRAS
ncbi:hypothetical protein ACFZAM_32100 [Streptomyces sp. NPDC008079]|uniref:hypothetical protein n=1 Tax=Streptomyces sp. NPDC008079 TaxID=3364806 RepID=UPI0036E362CB